MCRFLATVLEIREFGVKGCKVEARMSSEERLQGKYMVWSRLFAEHLFVRKAVYQNTAILDMHIWLESCTYLGDI